MKLLKSEPLSLVGRQAERAGIAAVALELVPMPLRKALNGRFDAVGALDGSFGVGSHDALHDDGFTARRV